MGEHRDDPGGSFNRCNLPPWAIASREFAAEPRPIEVEGVHEANRFLFQMLDAIADADERARRFLSATMKFQLHQWEREATRHLRAEYQEQRRSPLPARLGRGDSSSVEGAVLKGWSRAAWGSVQRITAGASRAPDSEAISAAAAVDRVRGHARTNAIDSQLDLLYTFTQYELARRDSGERWLTLWRGVHDAAEHEVLERTGRRDWLVRMNSLSSFTRERERAWRVRLDGVRGTGARCGASSSRASSSPTAS